MQLRDYQEYAVAETIDFLRDGSKNDGVVLMPTATGKSLVHAGIVREMCRLTPGYRVLSLTHVQELVEQNAEKLKAFWPHVPLGINCAGLGKRQRDRQVTLGSIGSSARVVEDFGHIDLVLVDECHRISTDAKTFYRRTLDTLRKRNPALRVVGLTATGYRLGYGSIIDGEMFHHAIVDMTEKDAYQWFFDQGYLCLPVPKATATVLDTSGVHTRGGEFIEGELQAAVDKDAVTRAALNEVLTTAEERNHILVFASGVKHAYNIAAMLEDEFGETVVVVEGALSKTERAARLNAFTTGRARFCVNNDVLTTGFDYPAIDCLVLLRPTKSTVLWVQMIGRGTRLHADKENCLVLDFAGNTLRLGPVNDPVIPRRKGEGGGGPPPMRVCPQCATINAAAARYCIGCKFEFPRESKLVTTASQAVLVKTKDSEEPKIVEFKVNSVHYQLHNKEGKPPSIRVTYQAGVKMFCEYVCLEHDGYASRAARCWWSERFEGQAPCTSLEAIELLRDAPVPKTISVWINQKYPRVMGAKFEEATT